ncbi:MAG: hypothetical protein AAF413_01320 [Patescibacteria group bacterium]
MRFARLTSSRGFILPTLVSFIVLITILGVIVVQVSLQSQASSVRQQNIQQAQLASATAMDFAKEQYEIDINYLGSPEVVLSSNDQYVTTYEVVHGGFTNLANTQATITAIGRVYDNDGTMHTVGAAYTGGGTAILDRSIRGKLTRSAGSGQSSRFIFIVDNSGSMSIEEWNDSKTTIDIAINHVINTVPTAEVAVVQYGTNNSIQQHKYDVTVPFTRDSATAVNWDRRYGNGTTAYWDRQDHLAGSLAVMRQDTVYGPGGELDLNGATNVQYVLFTDAYGGGVPPWGSCCSSLKRDTSEPNGYFDDNGAGFTVELEHGEFNAIKDGTVFTEDGYSGLTAQFTVININQSTQNETVPTSAAIASPGGEWTGAIDANPGDPEGEGILPRRYLNDSLEQTDPDKILAILDEIFEQELNI